MLDGLRGSKAGPWILASCIGLLATILIFVFAIYSNVYESVYHDHATSERRSSAQQQFDEECAGFTTVKELTACFEIKIHGYGEAQRSQEDLYAQKKMAQWAFWMLLVTGAIGVFTVLVTGVGVFFVARTLQATSDTLKAAQDANEIMRREQRPWVTFSFYEDKFKIENENDIIAAQIEFTATNLGRSPAINFRYHWDAFTIRNIVRPQSEKPIIDRMLGGVIAAAIESETTLPTKSVILHGQELLREDRKRFRDMRTPEVRMASGDYRAYFMFALAYTDATGELLGIDARVIRVMGENAIAERSEFRQCR